MLFHHWKITEKSSWYPTIWRFPDMEPTPSSHPSYPSHGRPPRLAPTPNAPNLAQETLWVCPLLPICFASWEVIGNVTASLVTIPIFLSIFDGIDTPKLELHGGLKTHWSCSIAMDMFHVKGFNKLWMILLGLNSNQIKLRGGSGMNDSA